MRGLMRGLETRLEHRRRRTLATPVTEQIALAVARDAELEGRFGDAALLYARAFPGYDLFRDSFGPAFVAFLEPLPSPFVRQQSRNSDAIAVRIRSMVTFSSEWRGGVFID